MADVDQVREALERTVPDFRGRSGDWAGILESAQADNRDRPGSRVLSLIRKRPGRTTLAVAAVAGAATAALCVSSPWKGSPGFLQRAQAGLTPPPGSIVHYTWEITSSSPDPPCTVTRGPSEIWIDQTWPHRYRALMNDLSPDRRVLTPRAEACLGGTPHELGGAFGTSETIMFVPPDTLRYAPRFSLPTDFVTAYRELLKDRVAHDEGKVQLDGRTVERIRLDPPPCPPGCIRVPAYAYFDPETFYPVKLVNGYNARPGQAPPPQISVRFLSYEYLPRTDANLALTDIHAQHPEAKGP